MKDLFIRRIYTHNGISVAVDIDLIAKTVSLVDKQGDNSFAHKNWYFTDRTIEYMNGWLAILDAMKHAITEAKKVLQAANERDEKEFAELLISLSHTADNLNAEGALPHYRKEKV